MKATLLLHKEHINSPLGISPSAYLDLRYHGFNLTTTARIQLSRSSQWEEDSPMRKRERPQSRTMSHPQERIRAPRIDTSDLIRKNELTLIGRLTNPKEQRIWAMISYFTRRWELIGTTEGVDLGNGLFKFRFTREDDLNKVLENRPYHFSNWMVII